MDHTPPPPPRPDAPSAPIHPHCWTPQRQVLFLKALAETRSVAAAAARAGMSRQSAYRLRHRKSGRAFAQAWALALDWRRLPALETPDKGPGDRG